MEAGAVLQRQSEHPWGALLPGTSWGAAGREGKPCLMQCFLCCEPPATHLQVLGLQGAVVFGDETCGEHQGELCARAGGPRCCPSLPHAARHLTVLRDGQEAHQAQALDGGHLHESRQ